MRGVTKIFERVNKQVQKLVRLSLKAVALEILRIAVGNFDEANNMPWSEKAVKRKILFYKRNSYECRMSFRKEND